MQNTSLTYSPAPTRCLMCPKEFLPRVRGQVYCGLSCRKKAERQRVKDRDPNRKDIEHRKTEGVPWLAELHDPTTEMLERWATAFLALSAASPTPQLVKVSGRVPTGWSHEKVELIEDFMGNTVFSIKFGMGTVVPLPKVEPKPTRGQDILEWAQTHERPKYE